MKPNILVLDTETTGLEDPIGIVEIAWQLLDWDLNLISKFDSLVYTDIEIAEEASATHGIREADLVGAPRLFELPFPEDPVILVCHNIRYDKPLVEPYLNIVDELCTVMTSRRLLPDADNHQLGVLAVHCDLPRTIAHRAPSDVLTVVNLLKYLLEGTGWDFARLLEFFKQDFIYKEMPIGKHRYKHCSMVPRAYFYWILGEDFDRDMIGTAKYWLKQGRKEVV